MQLIFMGTRRSGKMRSGNNGVTMVRARAARACDVAPRRNPAGESRAAAEWQSVRPDQVAKGRRLVRNRQYPSKRVLAAVAEVLAHGLQRRRS